jgi:hypothetical protein
LFFWVGSKPGTGSGSGIGIGIGIGIIVDVRNTGCPKNDVGLWCNPGKNTNYTPGMD